MECDSVEKLGAVVPSKWGKHELDVLLKTEFTVVRLNLGGVVVFSVLEGSEEHNDTDVVDLVMESLISDKALIS